MITDDELNHIEWKATRGCHYESAILFRSDYARELIEQDVHRLIREIRELQANIQATCTWQETRCYDDIVWETSCLTEFSMIDGTPSENNYGYCPNCGKRIEEIRLKDDE